MSTRAIIAIPTEKGYKTAWCWLDGNPDNLGHILRTRFKVKELANELIGYHSFESVMTAKEHEGYIAWRKRTNISAVPGERFVTLSNGCVLHMHKHQGKTVAGSGKYGFFRNVQDMLDQDLNYVYIFDNGKWITKK